LPDMGGSSSESGFQRPDAGRDYPTYEEVKSE
jgi:hypothetical protein